MVNLLAEHMLRALPEGSDPVQRLKTLAQAMGIGRPTRRTKRAFLALAHRLGIVPAEVSTGSAAVAFAHPPEAESVIRAREKARREARKEWLASMASRLQQSPIGLKVALAAKDQAAGAKALRTLIGLEVQPDIIGREELAFAASLNDRQLRRLLGEDLQFLPDEKALERGFQATKGFARICLLGSIKRQSLEGDAAQLKYVVRGVEISEDIARQLLGDYSPIVARRAAIKRHMLSLLEPLLREGQFPERAPDERWARMAWLTIVGYLTPPIRQRVSGVEGDRSVPIDRWQARRLVEADVSRVGLEVSQLQASLEVARRLVLGAALDRFARALA
jgi:hypothetical protein